MSLTRRKLLANLTALGGAVVLPNAAFSQPQTTIKRHNFKFCLNTSTIMGQNLGIVKEIETAATAGFDGIEIWINTLEKYLQEGNNLSDLKKRLDDLGLKVENAIGFAAWIVDNNDRRSAALEQAKREMDMLAQIGCHRIAAPPAGATDKAGLDLISAGERFRALVELGEAMEVLPQLEVWGFSKNLSKLSEVLFVAAECGHPKTRILPDAYHLFKGGSDFDGLKLMSKESVEIFHINDYPDNVSRKNIGDQDRVYPGEGVAPLSGMLSDLHSQEESTILSLELFNRDYWKQDALEVAKTGLRKMKETVEKALS